MNSTIVNHKLHSKLIDYTKRKQKTKNKQDLEKPLNRQKPLEEATKKQNNRIPRALTYHCALSNAKNNN